MEFEKVLAGRYRGGLLNETDRRIIDSCFEAYCFERGQLSIMHPYHYKAFEILFHNTDLTDGDLKRLREEGKTTRIKG